jgi:hypothetical protein
MSDREAFEQVFPMPENSDIKWYPEKQAYMSKVEMWKRTAKGRTDALAGWQAAQAQDGGELIRYGIEWAGPKDPIAVPMDDGYWTPWHIANQELRTASAVVPSGVWQFYQDGEWHTGINNIHHRSDTEAAGYKVRDLWATQDQDSLN